MKVRLSSAARDYLRAEAAYLRRHDPGAAERFLQRLEQARQTIGEFGGIGAGLPVRGLRRLVVGPYLLDYEVRSDAVLIVAIRHGRQAPPIPDDDDDDYEA